MRCSSRILAYVESSEEARYQDVCIMLRESETYGDTLEKVFARYGIPHFIDRQRPMKNHPLGELLTASLISCVITIVETACSSCSRRT